jgi:chemotaxis protein histidine kinase CheA
MATGTNPQPNMEKLRELLSPYLDGEVTPDEKRLVEEALNSSPELAAELQELEQTVNLLGTLPPVAAPRPFTLTEAELAAVGSPIPDVTKRPGWFGIPAWAGGVVALAAAMICVVAAGGILWGGTMGGSMSAPAEIAMQQESAVMPETDAEPAESGEEAPESAAVAPEEEAEVVGGADTASEEPQAEMIGEPSTAEQAEKAIEEANQADLAGLAADGAAEEEEALTESPAEAAPVPEMAEDSDFADEEAMEDTAATEAQSDQGERSAAAVAPGETELEQEMAAGAGTGADELPEDKQEVLPGSTAPQEVTAPTEMPLPEPTQPMPVPTSTTMATPTVVDGATVLARQSPTTVVEDTEESLGTATPAATSAQRTTGTRGLTLLIGLVVVLLVIGLVGWSIRRQDR